MMKMRRKMCLLSCRKAVSVSSPLNFHGKINMWNFTTELTGISCETIHKFLLLICPSFIIQTLWRLVGIPWSLHGVWIIKLGPICRGIKSMEHFAWNFMESPLKNSHIYFPTEIPWGMKPKPLFYRIVLLCILSILLCAGFACLFKYCQWV